MLKIYLPKVCVLLIASPIMAAHLVVNQEPRQLAAASTEELNNKLNSFIDAAVQAWEKNQAENKVRDEKINALDIDNAKLRDKIDKLSKENSGLRDGYVKQLSASMLNDLRKEKNSLIAQVSLSGAAAGMGALVTVGLAVLSERLQNFTEKNVFEPLQKIRKINGEILALETSPQCAILDDLRHEFIYRYEAVHEAQAQIGSFRRDNTSEDEGYVKYHVPHEKIAAVEARERENYEREEADFIIYKGNFNKLVLVEYEKLNSED